MRKKELQKNAYFYQIFGNNNIEYLEVDNNIDVQFQNIKLDLPEEIMDNKIECKIEDKNEYLTYNIYLNMTFEEITNWRKKFGCNKIQKLKKLYKLIKKIEILFWLEDLFKIKRYDIDKIENKLNDYKKELLKGIDNVVYLFSGIQGKKMLERRMIKKINEFEYIDQLQKFVADCYNCCYSIVDYKSTIINKNINKMRVRRKYYYDFNINLDLKQTK
jgi:hypothetical protein